jgi:hypothetical protein
VNTNQSISSVTVSFGLISSTCARSAAIPRLNSLSDRRAGKESARRADFRTNSGQSGQANFRVAPLVRPNLVERQPELLAHASRAHSFQRPAGILFILKSDRVLCACAPSIGFVIAGRFVQGLRALLYGTKAG